MNHRWVQILIFASGLVVGILIGANVQSPYVMHNTQLPQSMVRLNRWTGNMDFFRLSGGRWACTSGGAAADPAAGDR